MASEPSIGLDELGREVPDPTPIEVPFRLRGQESVDQRVARLVAASLSRHAAEQGFETEEEANDFDIDDDDATERQTEYELLGDEELADHLTRATTELQRRSALRSATAGSEDAGGGPSPVVAAGASGGSGSGNAASAGMAGSVGGAPGSAPGSGGTARPGGSGS